MHWAELNPGVRLYHLIMVIHQTFDLDFFKCLAQITKMDSCQANLIIKHLAPNGEMCNWGNCEICDWRNGEMWK